MIKIKEENFLNVEKELFNEGYAFLIGVDEAGRGPLAGPVVAGACALKNSDFLFESPMYELVRDSKTLSEIQREKVFDFIQENFWLGVGICDHKTIDRMNILEATFLAMKKAIASLSRNLRNFSKFDKKIILVDGNKIIPNFSGEQKAFINGDKFVRSISAASIIAKVTRDRIMREYDKQYPQYQFGKHKGYGTEIHMERLKKYGPCEIHRRSFRPVRETIDGKKNVY